MMDGNNHKPLGLTTVLGRVARAALGGVHTRAELLAVEWQEERHRLVEMFFWGAAALILSLLGGLVFTATIIFLFPPTARIYVAAAFALIYLCGAAGAGYGLKAVLKREPFCESIDQVRKDLLWLESLK
jgi:uncharacterized membrane protein YqjE